jgi:hypothetical protein
VLEWNLVLTGQDIDKKTGKGVVAPGPADFAGLFVDGKIDPGTLQGLGHEQAGDACTGDDNPKFSISHHASQDRPHPARRSLCSPLRLRQHAGEPQTRGAGSELG